MFLVCQRGDVISDKSTGLLLTYNNSNPNLVVMQDDRGKLEGKSIALSWDGVFNLGLMDNHATVFVSGAVITNDGVVGYYKFVTGFEEELLWIL